MEEWAPRDIADVMDGQEEIYDSYDLDERTQVHPEDLDLTDETGHEINIYDCDGYRIPRRYPLHDPDQEPCGLLADLSTIRALFHRNIDDYEDDDDSVINFDEDDEPLLVNVYPQAFTRQLGHFQANNIPAAFHPLVKRLNQTLAADKEETQTIIRGVACQGYNHVQHCLTERAGGLDVVHGQMTAALAGVIPTSPKARRAFEKVKESLRGGLPHAHLQRKLGRRDVLSRALRLEPVFVIDVQSLEARYQCGR